MANRKFDAKRRRALNIVWTASGDYSYEPDFLAFNDDGSPDLYLNSIIGFVRKWYDQKLLTELFASLNESALRETFADLLWLGLENCVFGKEQCRRPVLPDLRREHARAFFDTSREHSKQYFMMRNTVIHDLQEARWKEVLGQKPLLLNPWEHQLYKELAYDPRLTTEEICAKTRDILKRYFIFKFVDGAANRHALGHFLLSQKWSAFLYKYLPSLKIRGDDMLNVKNQVVETQEDRQNRLGKSSLNQLLTGTTNAKNYDYILKNFGRSMYSQAEALRLEKALCTGNHEHCHLHFTRGLSRSSGQDEAAFLVAQAARQRVLNLAYYRKYNELYRNCINRLHEQIMGSLAVSRQPLPSRTRTGTLVPSQVWRALYLDDNHVFTTKEEDATPNFTVDLMLDASMSRAASQEIIAAQAYAISESLRLCQIPLQIYSFCTIRGYTVLHLFKGYHENRKSSNIFTYFASGWNRDGLALRGARQLMGDFHSTRKLLIVLTDARPNDDVPLPGKGRVALSQAYGEKQAVEDTAAEAAALRREDIKVIGLINGEVSGGLPAARQIFGRDFARIDDLDKMAEVVGALLQKQIAQL